MVIVEFIFVNKESDAKQAYMLNLFLIDAHNNNPKKNRSFLLGENEFSDIPHDEFVQTYLGFVSASNDSTIQESIRKRDVASGSSSSLPSWVDWRSQGYVTSVKNQGGCGDCWAFSAVGALEGSYYRATGNLVSLSPQQILDCTLNGTGCSGSDPKTVFNYVKNNNISSDSSYPYTAQVGHFNKAYRVHKLIKSE